MVVRAIVLKVDIEVVVEVEIVTFTFINPHGGTVNCPGKL